MNQSTADYRLLAYAGSPSKPDRDSNDWHTPAQYIEAARIVLGRIDLDPFSSAKANETVKADRYFTKADNALPPRHWADRPITVWANPPYGRGVIDAAITRFLVELPRLSAAIVLTNNATETRWFQSMMRECQAVCFTDHRIAFVSPDNKAVSGNTRGQCFFYFGQRWDRFARAFKQFGPCCAVIAQGDRHAD
jgi:phage N-6-adenine-methyltransferase